MTAVLRAPQERGPRVSPYSRRGRSSSHRDLLPATTRGTEQESSSPMRHEYYYFDNPSSYSSSLAPSHSQSLDSAAIAAISQPSLPTPPISSRPVVSFAAHHAESTDNDIEFPQYDFECSAEGRGQKAHEPSSTSDLPDTPHRPEGQCPPSAERMPRTAGDDSHIEREPTRHVDYLTHEWREEDIWTSWRYVSQRGTCNNSTRLENAAWRSWAKMKMNVGTVAPESLNWHKDCDVTWLYGPLQTHGSHDPSSGSPSNASLSTSNSFLDKKSILKKKTVSQSILQHSLSSHTLLKQAGAIINTQSTDFPTQYLPSEKPSDLFISVNHASADSLATSASESPSSTEGRHISFNTEVAQCIAVDSTECEYPGFGGGYSGFYDDDSLDDDTSSEDSLVMMRQSVSRPPLTNQSTPRSSFGSDSKTIQPLPSTTLKFRGDTPEPEAESLEIPEDQPTSWWGSAPRSSLSRSSSAETLRPTTQDSHANFLLDDGDITMEDTPDICTDVADPSNWEFAGPSTKGFDSSWFSAWNVGPQGPHGHTVPPRSTSSPGVFVPFGYGDDVDMEDRDDTEEEYAMNYGLFGKVIDTVNTARDIAHVIWNVGWAAENQ